MIKAELQKELSLLILFFCKAFEKQIKEIEEKEKQLTKSTIFVEIVL